MKRFKWLILVVVLALFGLIVLTAAFHLARSETNTNSTLSWAAASFSGQREPLDLRRVFLHVEDRVGLGSTLAWELRRQLRESGEFDVVLVNNAPEPDDFPLLVVGIRDKNSLWTPFYSHADFRVAVAYSSYESTIQLDEQRPFNYDSGETRYDMPLDIRGDIQVTNKAVGLMTLPAYRRMLVGEPAEAIVKYLEESVKATKEEAAKRAAKAAENAAETLTAE